jgi:hypothetical protein
MRHAMKFAFLTLGCSLLCVVMSAQRTAPSADTVVPQLVNVSGRATDVQGKVISGAAGATFAVYKDQNEGVPLWLENQNIQADSKGNFSAQLGAATSGGVPLQLFASGEARWLGVRINGGEEQPRVLLVSVPYALKAADAQTLGGLPPSAFALAAPGGGTSGTAPPSSSSLQTTMPPVGGSGTQNYIPIWTDNSGDLGNSILYQLGTGSSAKIGINEKNPLFTLDVNGQELVRGLFEMATTNYATPTKAYNSQPFNLESSAYNSGTAAYTLNHFQWQAEPTGNNTTSPGATLNLLYGTDPAVPAETGLQLSNKGVFTFAPGQTFPGTGTITGVTTATGSGLTGGGTIGTLNLGLTNTCAANQILQWNGTIWSCSSAGKGTVTSVALSAPTTDFTVSGSPVTTSGTLGLNWIVAPTDKVTASAIVKRDASASFEANTIYVNDLEGGYVNAVSNADGVDGYGAYDGVYGSGLVGVEGQALDVTNGIGVYGQGTFYGVYGYVDGSQGAYYGVYGQGYGGVAGVYGYGEYGAVGVSGYTGGSDSTGDAVSAVSTGTGDGYYAYNHTAGAFAAFFDGNVDVDGNLSKAAGSFKIDHPLDPANKYLYHSFVESPDMKNIYDGEAVLDANGEAVVSLPDWFETLNRDFRYQLTPVGAPGPNLYIAAKVHDGSFKIAGGQAGMEVSWQVTGIRQDAWANAHRIPVEEMKAEGDRGLYMHPELFGAPPEQSISLARRPMVQKLLKEGPPPRPALPTHNAAYSSRKRPSHR